MARILRKMLTDRGGHCKANIGIHIDFANSHARGLAQHFLRDTNCIGHLAAELINHLHIFRHHRTRTVQNDWEAGQLFRHFSEDVKAQLRLLTGLELICTMACADGDGEAVHARALDKFLYLVGVGKGRVALGDDGPLPASPETVGEELERAVATGPDETSSSPCTVFATSDPAHPYAIRYDENGVTYLADPA